MVAYRVTYVIFEWEFRWVFAEMLGYDIPDFWNASRVGHLREVDGVQGFLDSLLEGRVGVQVTKH